MKKFLQKKVNVPKIYLIIILALITIIDLVLLLNAGTKSYSVVFVDNDNVYSYVVKKGNKINELKNEKSNFIGWYLNDEKFDFSSKIYENTTLKAKYKEITSYKVTFDTDGGTEIKDVFVEKGKTVSRPDNPEKENFVFLTWNLGDKEFDFNTKINKNETLKASWKEVSEEEKVYTISFDTVGGSKIDPIKVKSGDYTEKPLNPTKEGYNFVNWYLNGREFSWNFPIKSSFTLKALWQKKSVVKLSFNTNGGNIIKAVSVYKNETTKLPTPIKDGYVFNGWYYRSKKYTDNTRITKSLTLKASWITTDQANLNAAIKNIESSYEITKGGTKINVTALGCTITNTNSSILDNIKRNLNDTKLTLYFNIQCGTAKKVVKSTALIKKSIYTYSMDNLKLKLNGTNLDGELFKLDGTKITNILAGKVELSENLTGNIIFIAHDDQKTSYILKRIYGE